MSETIKVVTVRELAAPGSRSIAIGPFGSSLTADLYVESGVRVLRGQDITSMGRVAAGNEIYVDESTANRFPACIVTAGDLIFPHRGAIGRVGYIDEGRFLMSSSMMKLTCDDSVADAKFIFYYFRGPGKDELLTYASTVGTPGIGQPLSSLKSVRVPLPCLKRQRAVVQVLHALDDKIAANHLSVQAAQRLGLSLVAEASHEGELSSVSDLVGLLVRGIAPKYTDHESGTLVLNQKCVRDGRVYLLSARRSAIATPTKMLQPLDVLVNSTGVGTLGRAAVWTRDDRVTVDSHVTIVRFSRDLVDPAFAAWSLAAREAEIEELGEGSTGQTELKRQDLLDLKLSLPKRSEQRRVGAKLELLGELCDAKEDENLKLAELRDTLLGPLMSGKLTIKGAERVVEEVL